MSDVDEQLNLIKECWPKFSVTKENLLHPTQEFVIRFYSNFIEDYNEKIAYLTGESGIIDLNITDCELEEQICWQLSRLLGKIDGFKFVLGDIYQPNPLRTRNFMKICIHFIAFTEHLQNEAVMVSANVYETQEGIIKFELEQQEVINEIDSNAKYIAEITEDRNIINQEYVPVKNSYDEMKLQKSVKEKLYTDLRSQIEHLKCELQNDEIQLKQLQSTEKDLLKQRVTETEHQQILRTVNMLKSDSETLMSDDANIGDGLELENEVVQHIEDCFRILNKCKFKVENVEKLIQIEGDLKVISTKVNKLTSSELNPIKKQKIKIDEKLILLKKQLSDLHNNYNIVQNSHTSNSVQFLEEFNKLKNEVEVKTRKTDKCIASYKKDIVKLEEDMNKLKETFKTQYIKVSKVEKTVVDKFKAIILKCKDS